MDKDREDKQDQQEPALDTCVCCGGSVIIGCVLGLSLCQDCYNSFVYEFQTDKTYN